MNGGTSWPTDGRPLRVIHLTYSDRGGAGIACARLHRGLREAGVDSRMAVAHRRGDDADIELRRDAWSRFRPHLDRLPLRRYPQRRIFAWWSNNWLPTRLLRAVARENPDILHLHWVGDGWLNPAELAGGIPVVWTLHDTWAFTGGCHYPEACTRFTQGCGQCPQLASDGGNDLSARNYSRKEKAWAKGRPVFVTPSRWLADLARRSRLMANRRVEVIANGVDGRRFTPGDRHKCRASFALENDDLAIAVFAEGDAADVRKGVGTIGPALAALPAGERRRIRLLVVGAGRIAGLPSDIGIRHVPRVEREEALIDVYRAADAHALPTLQDNLPNTAVEAMACGCPVLAFATGGVREFVVPGENGDLAAEATVPALSAMFGRWVGHSDEKRFALAVSARATFLQKFALHERAADYLRLYQSVITGAP